MSVVQTRNGIWPTIPCAQLAPAQPYCQGMLWYRSDHSHGYDTYPVHQLLLWYVMVIPFSYSLMLAESQWTHCTHAASVYSAAYRSLRQRICLTWAEQNLKVWACCPQASYLCSTHINIPNFDNSPLPLCSLVICISVHWNIFPSCSTYLVLNVTPQIRQLTATPFQDILIWFSYLLITYISLVQWVFKSFKEYFDQSLWVKKFTHQLLPLLSSLTQPTHNLQTALLSTLYPELLTT